MSVLRLLDSRITSEALSLLTKAAPGFNGRATLYIESSLPCIFIKVTCGVARRLSAATMRLIYMKTPVRFRRVHRAQPPISLSASRLYAPCQFSIFGPLYKTALPAT